jgi:hypothetical protein
MKCWATPLLAVDHGVASIGAARVGADCLDAKDGSPDDVILISTRIVARTSRRARLRLLILSSAR